VMVTTDSLRPATDLALIVLGLGDFLAKRAELTPRVDESAVAVEKLFLPKFAKMKLRQDAL
jgi:hypothetical protein